MPLFVQKIKSTAIHILISLACFFAVTFLTFTYILNFKVIDGAAVQRALIVYAAIFTACFLLAWVGLTAFDVLKSKKRATQSMFEEDDGPYHLFSRLDVVRYDPFRLAFLFIVITILPQIVLAAFGGYLFPDIERSLSTSRQLLNAFGNFDSTYYCSSFMNIFYFTCIAPIAVVFFYWHTTTLYSEWLRTMEQRFSKKTVETMHNKIVTSANGRVRLIIGLCAIALIILLLYLDPLMLRPRNAWYLRLSGCSLFHLLYVCCWIFLSLFYAGRFIYKGLVVMTIQKRHAATPPKAIAKENYSSLTKRLYGNSDPLAVSVYSKNFASDLVFIFLGGFTLLAARKYGAEHFALASILVGSVYMFVAPYFATKYFDIEKISEASKKTLVDRIVHLRDEPEGEEDKNWGALLDRASKIETAPLSPLMRLSFLGTYLIQLTVFLVS